jgi:DnaJ domain
MDPYSTLGVPRGCTRQQVRDAFRSLVHVAHPDRGGDGEAFVRLCAAYRDVLAELERGDGREDGGPAAAPSGRGEAMPPGPGATRERYVAWLRQVSQESARRRPTPWWRKHPALAKAWLLGLIGLCGVLVLCAALALGMRLPGEAARRGTGPESGKGRWTIGAGATRSQSPGRR